MRKKTLFIFSLWKISEQNFFEVIESKLQGQGYSLKYTTFFEIFLLEHGIQKIHKWEVHASFYRHRLNNEKMRRSEGRTRSVRVFNRYPFVEIISPRCQKSWRQKNRSVPKYLKLKCIILLANKGKISECLNFWHRAADFLLFLKGCGSIN